MKVLVVLAVTVAVASAFPPGQPGYVVQQPGYVVQQPNYVQQTSYVQGPPQYVVTQHETQKKPGLVGSAFGGAGQLPAAILSAPVAVASALFSGVGQGLLAAGQAGTKGSTTSYLNVAESG